MSDPQDFPAQRYPYGVQTPGQPGQRWALPVVAFVAAVAVVVAVWALVTAESSDAAATTLPGDPTTRVCAAFDTVSEAVPLQTNTDLGNDPVAQSAVAANSRLALFGGGQYLLNSLDSETPAELADPVRSFAVTLQHIGMNALAGMTNADPDQVTYLAEGDATRQLIVDLCD